MNAAGAFNGLPRELRKNISPIYLAKLITRDRWRSTPAVPMQRPDRGNREQAAASASTKGRISCVLKRTYICGPEKGAPCRALVQSGGGGFINRRPERKENGGCAPPVKIRLFHFPDGEGVSDA